MILIYMVKLFAHIVNDFKKITKKIIFIQINVRFLSTETEMNISYTR